MQFSVNTKPILGHNISDHTIRPDTERIESLINFPTSQDAKYLKRFLRMFYTIQNGFSEKIWPLVDGKIFPMS